jgi:hypothetical protein
MSKGRTETKPFVASKYYNLKITKEDWCVYPDNDCPVFYNHNISGDLCNHCKYKFKLSIPELFKKKEKE